jgi:hypothetical protein
VLVGDALDPYSIALDFFSGKAVPCRPTAVRCHPQGTGEGQLGGAGLGAGILRYVSATAAEKPLPSKGPKSFPSWTSPVRPRSPALSKGRDSSGFFPSAPPSGAVAAAISQSRPFGLNSFSFARSGLAILSAAPSARRPATVSTIPNGSSFCLRF